MSGARELSGLVERVLTTREVAELERVSAQSVSQLCAAGEFPGAYRSPGKRGRWRIPESAVLERRKRLAAAEEERAARLQAASLRLEEYADFSGAIAPLMPRSRRRRQLGVKGARGA